MNILTVELSRRMVNRKVMSIKFLLLEQENVPKKAKKEL
jgi:hypothetical protein